MRAITGAVIMVCGAIVFVAISERHEPPIPSGILFVVGAVIVLIQAKEFGVSFWKRERRVKRVKPIDGSSICHAKHV
jgi:hypothetical protein